MRGANPKLSLILPIYNEKDNLHPLMAEIEEALDPTGLRYEVIAVDDGSKDGSAQILKELAATKGYLKVIYFRRNSGQTAAFDAGFRHAKGDVVVTLDSDLQNDPKDIPKMIAILETGYDFVAAWRRKRQDGFILRTFPSLIANWIIRRVTGTKIHDMGCSLKVFRREITSELRLYGEMHRFIAVLVEGIGARVYEYEVNHRPRVAGVSKYGIMRTFKVLLDLLTVWFMQGYRTKPIYVFGGTGVSLLALGALCTMVVAWQKFGQGVWVHKNPLFVLAIMVSVIGVQFLGLGLLAEMVIRTYFESQSKESYSIASKVGFEGETQAPEEPRKIKLASGSR